MKNNTLQSVVAQVLLKYKCSVAGLAQVVSRVCNLQSIPSTSVAHLTATTHCKCNNIQIRHLHIYIYVPLCLCFYCAYVPSLSIFRRINVQSCPSFTEPAALYLCSTESKWVVRTLHRVYVPSWLCSVLCMFHRICPTVILFFHEYVSSNAYSTVSMLYRYSLPSCLCSIVLMFHRVDVLPSVCSNIIKFRRVFVPPCLYCTVIAFYRF